MTGSYDFLDHFVQHRLRLKKRVSSRYIRTVYITQNMTYRIVILLK